MLQSIWYSNPGGNAVVILINLHHWVFAFVGWWLQDPLLCERLEVKGKVN